MLFSYKYDINRVKIRYYPIDSFVERCRYAIKALNIDDRCGLRVRACVLRTGGGSEFDSRLGQVNVCFGVWMYLFIYFIL